MLKLLRQALYRKPFTPIRVVMRSGERHDIRDPNCVAIGQTEAFVFAESGMVWLRQDEIDSVYVPRRARQS